MSIADRVSIAEAKVLAFAAEKSMTFSDIPAIIALSKSLAKDKVALDTIHMDRTTASYKMTHGLGKTLKEELIEELQNTFFSLNIDECTSKTNIRVVAVLASYYSRRECKVVVKHLSSFSIIKVDSESLYSALVNMFEEYKLPWGNLISVLMDSCNVMRGSKTGLETRIRNNKAPHLIDIDGDSCHHAHNAAKSFCEPFEKFVEYLLTSLFNDFKWSADKREALQLICEALGIKYTTPEGYVSHRWLSVYDVSLDTERMWDADVVFYFSFLTKKDGAIYSDCILEVFKKCNIANSTKEAIGKLQKKLGQKKMTKDGQARINRIIQKLFYTAKKTKVLLHIYTAVLPLLKKYVMLFQMNQPMIHLLNDKQTELLTNFMSLFIKPEVLKDISSARLVQLEVYDDRNYLPESSVFLVRYINSNLQGAIARDMVLTLKKAYAKCGKCLQTKMPVNNGLLKSISAIDPRCLGHTITVRHLLKLSKLIPNVLKDESAKERYDLEVRMFVVDKHTPVIGDTDIVTWWANVDSSKYPHLTRMVFSVLSCFHGPAVESNFSLMQQVMNTNTATLEVESLSAVQTVKYELKSSGKSALEYFDRGIHDPINPHLCRNMRAAYRHYQEHKDSKKEKKEDRLNELGIVKPLCRSVSTKTKAKLQAYARAQLNIVKHTSSVKRKHYGSTQTKPAKQQRTL